MHNVLFRVQTVQAARGILNLKPACGNELDSICGFFSVLPFDLAFLLFYNVCI